MIKRILVGLGDLDHARCATRYALDLAERHGCELTAVTLVDLERISYTGPVPIGGSGAAMELRDHRLKVTYEIIESAVQDFTNACADAGIKSRVLHEVGDPFQRMISDARYHDLVICGLRGVFEHGVVAEPPVELARLVDAGVRPLLAVTPVERTIQRALIAYSGSTESAKTMKRFIQCRLWPDVKLRIVTFDHPADEAEQLLADAADYCRAHGYEPEVEKIAGSPKHQLLPYAAEWSADLIVMGNSARNMLLRRILGETALHVMQQTDRPLFLCQ